MDTGIELSSVINHGYSMDFFASGRRDDFLTPEPRCPMVIFPKLDTTLDISIYVHVTLSR